ncbi:transglycosylase domain-containing protein [Glycomyces sp. TRM65418]|uniref:transglycosylase domain-containing protein n=1 Tax=Glycomyces sp. TRM65418 TaxID=2867006 RepID=UPI001CE5156C|nr:transglycosylase domain-containing protein [Glycomyces sp. TRM65418]MCC3763798.1 transglycosylase domain-containing protein [Glycomyces sp. TRM65418]QZD53506.1 transglycosylase domain-containing protein [Glycomyces sp. TRM65418]
MSASSKPVAQTWFGPITAVQRRAMFALVPVAVAFGLVVGLAFLPLASGFGGLAKVGSETVLELPDELVLPPAPESSTLYASDGTTVIATFGDQYRVQLEYDQIPESVINALIATEDSNFFEHNGVDPEGVMRALVTNVANGGTSEGASTITMQYVRQVLSYTATTPDEVAAASEITIDRKVKEMGYALALEEEMSKQEILTNYLNTVYFGNGAYGIGAAAQVYYGKVPADLTVAESAMLVGLVQSPSSYDPINGSSEAAQVRRDHVINRMTAVGFLTGAEGDEAKAEGLNLNPQEANNTSGGAIDSEYGFFVDYFEQWWEQQADFGETEEIRKARLYRGGYEITSTLDVGLQDASQEAVERQVPIGSEYALGSVVVEPGTGAIQVMAVNREYSNDISGNGPNTAAPEYKGTYPNTTNPLLSGNASVPGYQAGSSFKMFTMLAALEAGMPLDTTIYSPYQYTSQYVVGDGAASCGNYWCPKNASESEVGDYNMWTGFGESVNTYFVQLAERVGVENAIDVAKRLGIEFRAPSDLNFVERSPETFGPFVLGVTQTTPLDMAAAYAALPADGVYCKPIPVTSATTSTGKEIPFTSQCDQAVSVEVARAAVDAARCPTEYGAATGNCTWGTAPQVGNQVDGPVAGKTGTTDSNSTNWFVGFTPNAAAAAFVADPDSPENFVGEANLGKPANAVAEILAEQWRTSGEGDFTPPTELVH